MKLSVSTFSGIAPRISPRLLQGNQAQVARNVRLLSGDLEEWKGTTEEENAKDGGVTKTLYLFDRQYWFQWFDVVDVVRGPVPNDDSHRTYFTGFGVPRFTDNVLALTGGSDYPVASYTLGLPAPADAPSATVQGTADDDDPGLLETRFYVQTYVSKYGEESPPSEPSNSVELYNGQSVVLSNLKTAPSGEFVVDKTRIYRTTSSGSATEYQFVAEIPVTQTTYTDEIASEALGEILPSEGWIAPPEDMHSLVAMPNGILAGVSGLDICVCEQYMPSAWPMAYRHTADDEVVGLGVFDNSLVVLTGRYPYLVTGATPASMTMTKIGSDEFACVSKRGIATMPGAGVVFPTPDGLAAIGSSGIQNLTARLVSKREWQAYKPSTMMGVVHEGRYFGFYDGGCIVVDPVNDALYELDLQATAAYRDAATDTLYLVVDDKIVSWNTADTPFAPFTWQSKRFDLPYPAVLSCGRIHANDYSNLTLKVHGDDAVVASLAVASDQPFRLPAVSRYRTCSLELTGSGRVYSAELAETIDELI